MAPHVCHIGTPLLLRLSFLSQNFMIPKSLTLQSLCLGGSKDMVFNHFSIDETTCGSSVWGGNPSSAYPGRLEPVPAITGEEAGCI